MNSSKIAAKKIQKVTFDDQEPDDVIPQKIPKKASQKLNPKKLSAKSNPLHANDSNDMENDQDQVSSAITSEDQGDTVEQIPVQKEEDDEDAPISSSMNRIHYAK